MDEQDVLPALFIGHLADSLQVRLTFDIADRAADLGDNHIAVAGIQAVSTRLDLVGDVRNNLNGAPKIIPAALAV